MNKICFLDFSPQASYLWGEAWSTIWTGEQSERGARGLEPHQPRWSWSSLWEANLALCVHQDWFPLYYKTSWKSGEVFAFLWIWLNGIMLATLSLLVGHCRYKETWAQNCSDCCRQWCCGRRGSVDYFLIVQFNTSISFHPTQVNTPTGSRLLAEGERHDGG